MRFFRRARVALLFAGLGVCFEWWAYAGNADRVEEILGTPQGIPVKEFRITAKRSEFTPNLIAVNQGDYFKLRITALDGDHGFKIPGTNINHVLKKGRQEDIVFYARDRGKVVFECSKFCGIGFFFMKGTILIE